MVEQLYAALTGEILPALAERGLRLVRPGDLEPAARAALSRYFRDEVLPALTPLAIDTSRPFPMLSSLSLNLAVLLGPPDGEDAPRLAVVQVPGRLPRLVRPPGVEGMLHVLLEDVIWAELASLFPGQEIRDVAAFRIARDSELDFDDEGGRDFLQVIEEELRNRRRSGIVRLEVEDGVSASLVELLMSRLELAVEDVYRIRGPVDVRPLMSLVELPLLEDLRDPPLKPQQSIETADLFALLDEKDVRAAAPLRVVRPGGGARLLRGGRPRRARDQADALPHQRRLAGRAFAGARRGERQAGDRAGRAARALRRAVEHPLVAAAGGVGLPRHLRHPRLQDPLQDPASSCGAAARASGATCTSARATTTRRPRASTPISA